MGDFAIKGDICYSAGPRELRTQAGGYLVCRGGESAGVFDRLPPEYADLPLEDCSGKLILPGLVDLHLHGPQFGFRALGMDLELLDWLEQRAFPEEAKFADLAYARLAYGQFAAELRGGATTRACVFATCHTPATLLLMELLEASGLVSLVGKVNMDRNCPDSLREEGADSLAQTRRWLRAAPEFARTRPILTPRFFPACSPALLEGLAALGREHALPLQTHLSENLSEVAWVKELSPGSAGYLDAYRACGLLEGPAPKVMAHCVWVTPEEIEQMAKGRIFVAHCPGSNNNLASGLAPVRALLEAGVPVGLGSDVAGGHSASVFRAMADAIQASKLRWRLVEGSGAPLTLEEAFYLGTAGGGAFFGRVGSFAPGYRLDALILDDSALAAPFPLSLRERLERMVYLSHKGQIVGKIVDGIRIW